MSTLAAGAEGVWFLNWTDHNVTRIDQATNRVAEGIPIKTPGDAGIAVGGGAVSPAAACGAVESGGATPDVLIASDLPLQGGDAGARDGPGPQREDRVRQLRGRRRKHSRADGSGLRQVTNNTVDDGGPAWSPNADRLVFHRWDASESEADLVTVRVNGTDERNLTRSPGVVDRAAIWSPDGREIVFMRDDSGRENDIATIRPDGSHVRALTATPTDEESPDWSPEGKRIAFHAHPTQPLGEWDVYVMRRDGGSPPTLAGLLQTSGRNERGPAFDDDAVVDGHLAAPCDGLCHHFGRDREAPAAVTCRTLNGLGPSASHRRDRRGTACLP